MFSFHELLCSKFVQHTCIVFDVVGIVVIVTGSTIRIDPCKTKIKKNFTREEYRLRGHSCWIKKQASSLLPQPNLSLAVVTSIHKPRIIMSIHFHKHVQWMLYYSVQCNMTMQQ